MGKDGRWRNIIFTTVRRVRAQNCLSHALSFLHSVQTQACRSRYKVSVLYAYSEPGGRKDAQQIFGAETGSCSQRGARKRTQRIVLWKPAPVNGNSRNKFQVAIRCTFPGREELRIRRLSLRYDREAIHLHERY